MAPRWRKVLADLWANKTRTVLTVLSIAVGVLVVGAIATIYVILGRDMDVSFQEINPAGAIMYTSQFDGDFLAALHHVPGVAQVEARTRMSGLKVQPASAGPAESTPLELRSNPDYAKSQLDHLILHAGDWPAARELVIERNGLKRLPVKVGDTVLLTKPDGRQREFKVAGFVEDRTTDSSGVNVYGYITPDTLEYLGQSRNFNFLEFTVRENPKDREHVRAVARLIEEQFMRNGGAVSTTLVRDGGRHPNSQQVTAVMALLAALGFLTILLSAFLVVNTVSALMAQQVRYIGVMKAIGGDAGQILGMYLVLLFCLGAMALLLAAPLGLKAGYFAAQQIATGLNFTIAPFQVEWAPLGIMIFLSIAVPVLAGFVPVLGGARMTIRAAISGYGLGGATRRGILDRLLAHVQGFSRPLLVSLRNTIRRRARLVLTLATLILAGAIFTGVISTKASMSGSLAKMYRYYTADVNANFDEDQRTGHMIGLLSTVPGVARVEAWNFASGEVMVQDATARQSRNGVATDRLTVTAPPTDSQIVPREVASGRWLAPEDRNGIVMCTAAMRAHPEWQLGSTVMVRLNSKVVAPFVIVGVFPFASGEGNKIGMVSPAYLADTLNQRGQASYFRIITSPRDAQTQDRVRDQVNDLLKSLGYRVNLSSGHTDADALGRILNLIIAFLMGLALLIGLVGGLGLMGMMSMNVMERTREIGVMRSIGATNGAIMQLVIVEGLLIGILSWAGGALLGIPVGRGLASVLGQGLFGTPFTFVMDWSGVAMWLGAVVVLSIVASILPAWNASRLTIREVLAYE